MYTYKQAVKDSKEFIASEMAQNILEKVEAPVKNPSHKDVLGAIDEVYRMFYKSLLFKGTLYKQLYKKRQALSDEMFLPDWLGKQIIKYLVLFFYCEDFRSPKLKELRALILELIGLYESYITSDKVTEEEYKDMINLKL